MALILYFAVAPEIYNEYIRCKINLGAASAAVTETNI